MKERCCQWGVGVYPVKGGTVEREVRGGKPAQHLQTEMLEVGGVGTQDPGGRDLAWLRHCQILGPRTARGTQSGFSKHLRGEWMNE